MRVKMLELRIGELGRLNEGRVYDLPDELAHRYIARGVAEYAETPSVLPETLTVQSESSEPPPADPLEGLNAKQAANAIAGFDAEQLDAIPDSEARNTVRAAIAKRRAELVGP